MKKVKVFCILFLLCQTAFSQFIAPKVFSAGGGNLENQYININYTIGEPFTETAGVHDFYLTAGFNQPMFYEIVMTGEFFAAPNPVENIIYLKGPLEETLLLVKLTDISGHNLFSGELNFISEKLPFNLSFLPEGIFLLELQQGSLQHTFKIVKIR